MKKFVILLAVAAVIGFVVAGNKEWRPQSGQREQGEDQAAVAEPGRGQEGAPAGQPQAPAPPDETPASRRTQEEPTSARHAPPVPPPVEPPPVERAGDEPELASLKRAQKLIRQGEQAEARKLLIQLCRAASPQIREAAQKMLDLIDWSPPERTAVEAADGTAAEPEAESARVPPLKTEGADLARLTQAEALIKEGKRVEARKLLTEIYRTADARTREAAREILDMVNKDLVFDPDCREGAKVHAVQPGELLGTIAAKHDVSWRMLARINAVDPRRIREGQELKILVGKSGVFVDKSEFRLALFIDGQFIKEYAIGHGKGGKTPAGTFVIERMMIRPDWYPPQGGVIRYGEEGHLIGERWLGFKNRPGATGLGIHGTSDPESIGTQCSNGCIRMLNEDVIELFDFVTLGTKVEIVE